MSFFEALLAEDNFFERSTSLDGIKYFPRGDFYYDLNSGRGYVHYRFPSLLPNNDLSEFRKFHPVNQDARLYINPALLSDLGAEEAHAAVLRVLRGLLVRFRGEQMQQGVKPTGLSPSLFFNKAYGKKEDAAVTESTAGRENGANEERNAMEGA